MAFFHVLLNGTGTSGDGSTWNDLSDATSAYIGIAGLNSISQSAAAGDIIFVKGTETAGGTSLALGPSSITLALAQNPIRIYGCKSATTNTGGSIVTSDLIPGLRTSDTDEAWNDADVPTISGGTAIYDIRTGVYVYGIKFVTSNNVLISSAAYGIIRLEECHCETTGSANEIGQSGILGRLKAYGCKIVSPAGNFIMAGYSDWHNTVFSAGATATAFFDDENFYGSPKFWGCTFEGGETTIIQRKNTSAHAEFFNCKFPTSWTFTTGTAAGAYEFESYGSDDSTGLSTSEQQVNLESQHGTVVLETTAVRTGGADDGAAGAFSWDMTPFANGAAASIVGLQSPWMNIWVKGSGASKTLTVYFTSDSGNTRATDWNDDEVWLNVESPDDAGSSVYSRDTTVADLLATGTAVTDDTTSTWAGSTQNPQKLEVSIDPDYEGYVRCRVNFVSGANADTIYVDPDPEIT